MEEDKRGKTHNNELYTLIKILNEHKKIPKTKPLRTGCKRVQALVSIGGHKVTRHIDIPK